ncbi:hypothetical protein, partial [Pseudomonas aeruginosa]|uniref:hypothetical protein n=1 Tax=Pseudomonas aeruginosa TaxID=287 RepID=UPI003134A30A
AVCTLRFFASPICCHPFEDDSLNYPVVTVSKGGSTIEILFDSCRDFQGSKMRYCLREQATHVTLTGIAGAIAPIEECTVTGMVPWPDELLEEAREKARRKGERGEMLF